LPPSSSLSALSLLVTCGVHAEYKTKVGIAQAVASVKFPANMIVAGGSDGNSANPFDAIGLQSLYNLSNQMAK